MGSVALGFGLPFRTTLAFAVVSEHGTWCLVPFGLWVRVVGKGADLPPRAIALRLPEPESRLTAALVNFVFVNFADPTLGTSLHASSRNGRLS